MDSTKDIVNKINDQYNMLSKGQKRLAAYIMDNYDKAVFLTATKLGEAVGVSESTVVRFAMNLGYKGYPEFQKSIEELVQGRLNKIEKMEVTYGHNSQSQILENVLAADAEKIKYTLEHTDGKAFEQAVDTLINARKVYIIGLRSCAPLASFLGFYFNMLLDNVLLINTNSTTEIFEQMLHIDKDDAIIGISFPRYSMRTLKALEFANNKNAAVITLTDNIHAPINLYSSCNLVAKSEMVSIVDSLVAPLSVINALVVAICMKQKEKVITTLEELERIWDEYQIYNNDEMNYLDSRSIEEFGLGDRNE
ncbi:RpiR family transcriptional regulator [Lachnotalea glycerini]|uniref:RpiR family transcriptional regulator n=1 Tax=Lachnotalea glycerini TaxID=1763509 RepID=A0A255IPD9_9FIRM|nr:MurR/RpiR family transcriptional regulator [Lachnotalea glycerini]PXV85650.1 RpiR family transcriptional regulator [Lachnotalea glycerini]RDY31328.1 MurR/RpiR family transcriptional regulator [Lachnotalea glycerini]